MGCAQEGQEAHYPSGPASSCCSSSSPGRASSCECWDINKQFSGSSRTSSSSSSSQAAAATAAARAAESLGYKPIDAPYSSSLLGHAEQLFAFADRHRAAYTRTFPELAKYYNSTTYQDELLWGAAWLHKASRQRVYRDYIKKNEVALGASDSINEFGWDNKHAGLNVLISKVQKLLPSTLFHF